MMKLTDLTIREQKTDQKPDQPDKTGPETRPDQTGPDQTSTPVRQVMAVFSRIISIIIMCFV